MGRGVAAEQPQQIVASNRAADARAVRAHAARGALSGQIICGDSEPAIPKTCTLHYRIQQSRSLTER